MATNVCECGGELKQVEFRERREVGVVVQLMWQCQACGRRTHLDPPVIRTE